MSSAKDQPKCFGCGTAVRDEPGIYYCDECIATQLREQGDERAAFDAYHVYADRIARGEGTKKP